MRSNLGKIIILVGLLATMLLVQSLPVNGTYQAPAAANPVKAKAATQGIIKKGNISSNIYNGGKLATDKDWLYYVDEGMLEANPGEDGYQYVEKPGIFAKRLDDSGEPRRVTDALKDNLDAPGISCLNVVEGWIYYLADKITARHPDRGYVTATQKVLVDPRQMAAEVYRHSSNK